MSVSTPYPAQVELHADGHITRWRPLIQWLLAVPQLMVAEVLSSLRGVLTLISLFTVLFTKEIPRPLFDVIAMTYRYEWRAMSYALFLHEDYPPFDFRPASADDGAERHTTLSLAYPGQLNRWAPLYKWFLAIPHYVILAVLSIGALFAVVAAWFSILFTGRYPRTLFNYVVGVMRWSNRVSAYAFVLATDKYPPFRLSH